MAQPQQQHMKYRRVYRMLVDFGHSPIKAAEIIIDAGRGKQHALQWIWIIHGFLGTGCGYYLP